MLSGGEKSKIRRLVAAVNKKYPEILEILDTPNVRNDSKKVNELLDIVRDIFKWTSNISYLVIKNNQKLNNGFDSMQLACRKLKVNVKDSEQVDNVFNAVEAIYDMHKEFINLVDSDTNFNEAVLKQVMEELGLKMPKKENSTNKKDDSKYYSSIDDLFADLED